jgi:hypothetical protein
MRPEPIRPAGSYAHVSRTASAASGWRLQIRARDGRLCTQATNPRRRIIPA